jgi:hypothetical protein
VCLIQHSENYHGGQIVGPDLVHDVQVVDDSPLELPHLGHVAAGPEAGPLAELIQLDRYSSVVQLKQTAIIYVLWAREIHF